MDLQINLKYFFSSNIYTMTSFNMLNITFLGLALQEI